MKEALERPQSHDHQVNPAVMQQPAGGGGAEAPAWAGSPETAGAKESVRRDAAALRPDQAEALGAAFNVPTHAQLLEQDGASVVTPEFVAQVAADPNAVQARQRAIGDAYSVVMAGGAAANGQGRAQSAISAAPAHMREAAQSVSKAPGAGSPLPADVRAEMEAKFGGEDFSSVQVHTGNADVTAAGAGAATRGEHIHFADGKYDPESAAGKKLIAHELTHVVQQRGASASGKEHVAASSSHAEQEAEHAGDAVADGQQAKVARGSAPADAVHFGEAIVHQGIELDAAGVERPKYQHSDGEIDPQALTPQQRAAFEMYAGNFIRDYSQFAVPLPIGIMAALPSTNKGGKVGEAGARSLIDAFIQALAILELGKDVAKGAVKHANIGVYEAEHHIDNPIGANASGDFVTDGAKPHNAVPPQAKAVRTVDALGASVDGVKNASPDLATQQTHAGSANAGLQFENPELYKVGDGGLQNHIANSSEHSKNCFLEASAHGPTPVGRMKLGMGQHIIEDFFSHSNFIEIALNQYINSAITSRKSGKAKPRKSDSFIDEFADRKGNVNKDAITTNQSGAVRAEFIFVDSLYDKKTKDGQQALTTGTFGGGDTKVSIGHALLPKLPKMEHSLHAGVDVAYGAVQKSLKEKKPPTWERIKMVLDQSGNIGAATAVVLEGTKAAGLGVPCPVGFHLNTRTVNLPLFGATSVPTGIGLEMSAIPFADAFVAGGHTYVAVMEKLDEIKKAADFFHLGPVLEAIKQQMQEAMNQMMQAVHAQISKLMREIIVGLVGKDSAIDPEKLEHAGIDELAELAEHEMHSRTEQTSVQSRMERKNGDLHELTVGAAAGKAELERRVGPVVPKFPFNGNPGSEENPWVTRDPLPPSHSEISKDHPPHHAHVGDKEAWHADGPEKQKVKGAVSEPLHDAHKEQVAHDHEENGHDHSPHEDEHDHEDLAEGSNFYGLHRALATEADRHVMRQIEIVWKAQLIPGQNIDETKMQVGHDLVQGEARGVAGNAAKDAAAEGTRFAQTDARVPEKFRSNGDVMTLLDLVDYFVSHPSAGKWWETIFDNYIATNGEEVHASILARNKTRNRRH